MSRPASHDPTISELQIMPITTDRALIEIIFQTYGAFRESTKHPRQPPSGLLPSFILGIKLRVVILQMHVIAKRTSRIGVEARGKGRKADCLEDDA